MGIDWSRMAPRRGCDQEELSRLVEQQAAAFQGMPYYWSTDGIGLTAAFHESTRRQWEQQYLSSSRALRELLIFPQCDTETAIPTDHPDLEPCWRVYPITRNTIFPPRWRREALRTFLPQELHQQAAAWKAWATAVAKGQRQNYLVELYLHETTMLLAGHARELKSVAEASLPVAAKWASRPALASVRERILAFPTPAAHPAPLESALTVHEQSVSTADHPLIAALWNEIQDLIALTRSWDRNAKDRWKMQHDDDYYQTFQQYLSQSEDPWLHSFFDWAERCSQMGFGLFLDY